MSLGSCTILIDFNRLWPDIRLYMSTMYTLDLTPKYVISYPSSNLAFHYNFESSSYSHITIVLEF